MENWNTCSNYSESKHVHVKAAISASLMFFAPELFFADVSTLSCFHGMKNENNSILAEIPLLGAFFPDLILIVFQPVIPCKGYNYFFSDKSRYAYEILCDICSCLFDWCFLYQCLFLEPKHSLGIFSSKVTVFNRNQRTNGPVNAHLISWPSKAQKYKIWKIYGKEMTLTFYTQLTSISCLHLPTFRSQAAIVSEKSTVFTFSHRKP